MKPKILFLVADGMGDHSVAELDGRTPLEAARTPHMDTLAARGLQGTCRTIPEGMPPGSDVANMALLGYDPAAFHTGRGPIEAAAQGLDLAADDLVWRLNLVTTSQWSDQGVMRDYSAGHIETEPAHALIHTLQDELGNDEFTFFPGVQYRHLLVQRGGAGKPEAALDVRPPHDITDRSITADLKTFDSSPGLSRLTRRAADILAGPSNTTRANGIWPWGQGKRLSLPPFVDRFELTGAVVTAVDLVRGLGRAASMAVLEVEGVTGLLDTNYQGKVDAAVEFLRKDDFVYLHVEAPDECGHSGILEDKIEAIERFDARILGPLLQHFSPDEAVYMVTCDHLTPIKIRTHTDDPVPFLFTAPGLTVQRPQTAFCEQTASSAGLHIDRGEDLLDWMIDTLPG